MIDRLQKWVKCNFPSPLIGIHGQPHWRLGVSGFTWFESTGKVRLPKCGNCSVPCIFTLLHYKMWYYPLEGNLQSVRDNLWATPQGLRVIHLVDTVITLVYSLVSIEHGYSAYCCVGAGSSLFTQSSAPLLEAVEAGQRRRKVTFY